MNNGLLALPAVALAVALSLSACTTLRVTSDVNIPVKSSVQCHTFSWVGAFKGGEDSLRTTIANPVNESRLRAAIQANLATVGVQPATEHADCLVGYGIGNHQVLEGGYEPYGWGWGWGWGGPYGYAGGWGWDYPYVYNQGVIAVDLYDAKSNQPIWHASADQTLVGVTGDRADEKIRKAVAAIFTKYPR